jgi:predicted aldo/keto reductase-like oxidoreductase
MEPLRLVHDDRFVRHIGLSFTDTPAEIARIVMESDLPLDPALVQAAYARIAALEAPVQQPRRRRLLRWFHREG